MPAPHSDARTILICLDSYDHDIPSGRFFCPSVGEAGTFSSLSQMLTRIDSCLDIQGAPQSFCKLRSFSALMDLAPGISVTSPSPGEIATFSVRLLFRRNASWQGTVTWQETDRTIPFRSALELIYLIISAAGQSRGVPSGFPVFENEYAPRPQG